MNANVGWLCRLHFGRRGRGFENLFYPHSPGRDAAMNRLEDSPAGDPRPPARAADPEYECCDRL